MDNSEKIWYEDIAGFLSSDNYYVILPMQNMSLEEKLNALVRFFIYLGVILAILKSDSRYMFFGIIAALISVVLYSYEKGQKEKAEKFLESTNRAIVDQKICTRSTVDNPFMNPSIYDIGANPDKPPACSHDNPKVAELVEDNFNERLFRDTGDLYGRMASQRQFYTMPNTSIPNAQTGFAEFLFGRGKSCKEANGDQCYDNIYTQTAYR